MNVKKTRNYKKRRIDLHSFSTSPHTYFPEKNSSEKTIQATTKTRKVFFRFTKAEKLVSPQALPDPMIIKCRSEEINETLTHCFHFPNSALDWGDRLEREKFYSWAKNLFHTNEMNIFGQTSLILRYRIVLVVRMRFGISRSSLIIFPFNLDQTGSRHLFDNWIYKYSTDQRAHIKVPDCPIESKIPP